MQRSGTKMPFPFPFFELSCPTISSQKNRRDIDKLDISPSPCSLGWYPYFQIRHDWYQLLGSCLITKKEKIRKTAQRHLKPWWSEQTHKLDSTFERLPAISKLRVFTANRAQIMTRASKIWFSCILQKNILASQHMVEYDKDVKSQSTTNRKHTAHFPSFQSGTFSERRVMYCSIATSGLMFPSLCQAFLHNVSRPSITHR